MFLKKTFIFFLPNFDVGGAGNSIYKICKNIKRTKNEIIIISLGPNYYKKNFKKLNIKIIELPFKRTLSSIFTLKKITYFHLKNKRKKIVFISNINYANVISCIFLRKFKRFKRFKLVLFERTPIQELDSFSNIKQFFKRKIVKFCIRFFYKEANYIIGNSSNVSKNLEKICGKKVITLNPIVEKNKSIKKNNKIKKILWVGRNSYEKNIKDLLLSLNHIKNKKYNLTIISNPIINLQDFEIPYEIKKKIKVLGFQKNKIEKFFKESDIFISTSIYEGFPNVVVEAIRYNCLIISSKSYGGITDIIKNEKYGYLYNTYNTKELSSKIESSLENSKNNLNKMSNARKNLNLIYLRNEKINFFFENI